MNRTALACTTIATLGFVSVAYLIAGPLNPPAGPVVPTHKTLSEVEPRIAINATNTPGDSDSLFKITQSGSYYLTGNINGVAGRSGIEIAANNVTIELGGFTLRGGPGTLNGMTAPAVVSNVNIRDGIVTGWGASGIALNNANSGTLRGITASVSGSGVGITVGSSYIIESCVCTENGTSGFTVLDSVTFRDCVASYNGNDGFASSGFACSVEGCSALFNGADGFSFAGGASVVSCTSARNTGSGIHAGFGSVVTACAVRNNSVGISSGDSCTIANNSTRQNTTNGVSVGDGCIVSGNSCEANGDNGDGAGIYVAGSSNRIEGNNCSGADRGIDVDSAGNIIIGNTCSGNATNWAIVLNNIYGPIIDRSAPVTAAVNGNSAASSLGTTDPNANFTY